MAIKDLSKSLVDSVIEVMSQREDEYNAMSQRLFAEGLRKFGVKRLNQLSEDDVKALTSWVHTKLDEACSYCGSKSSDMSEDDMPGDSVYHKGGDEVADKKKEIDEENEASKVVTAELEKMGKTLGELSPEEKKKLFAKVDSLVKAKNEAADSMTDKQKFSALRNIKHVQLTKLSAGKNRVVFKLSLMGKELASMDSPMQGSRRPEEVWITPEGEALLKKEGMLKEADAAKKDYDGDGEVESSSDEYLGARDKAIKKAMAKEEDSKEVSEEDEVVLDKLGEASDSDIDWECSDCDSRGRRSSDANQDRPSRDMRNRELLGLKKLPFLSKEQKRRLDVLKTLRVKDNKAAMNESVAIEADELATNGAVGVTDANEQMPIHADVLMDSDPLTGTHQYRLFVQFATNNMPTIVPPPVLPGAPTIEDLRMIVEGLPYFGEAIERALVAAVEAPSSEARFRGNDKA